MVVFKSQTHASPCHLQHTRVTHPSAGLERQSSLSLWDSSLPSLSLRWLSLFSNWKDDYSRGTPVWIVLVHVMVLRLGKVKIGQMHHDS